MDSPNRLVISAPFGNYFTDPNAISTLGTFTVDYRGGVLYRVWKVASTVRYYHGIGAWKNKLGLPNPGIDWLHKQVQQERVDARDKIVSVCARNVQDWTILFDYLQSITPAYVELNISCPNVGEKDESNYRRVFEMAVKTFGERAIVKLPPVGYRVLAHLATCCGINAFHCCNTLPTPGGGLSGAPLKPLSLSAVAWVRFELDPPMLIGGGGVVTQQDAQDYLGAGATHVAIASTLFFPWRWRGVRRMAKELRRPSCPGFPASQDAPCG